MAAQSRDDELVIVGRIVRAHGIRGEVVVEVLTESPDAVYAPGARVFSPGTGKSAEPVPLTVEFARPFKDMLLVTFEEVPDRTEAERWRDRFLLVPTSEIEAPAEDEVFVHDLVGLELSLPDGSVVGKVIGTFEVAGRLLLDVQRASGTILIPWELPFVQSVDTTTGRLVMQLPDGLLD